jgi:hypothetical protein
MTHRLQIVRLAAAAALLFSVTSAQAGVYRGAAAFQAALAGFDTATVDFDTTALGTIVASGAEIGGVRFDYNYGTTRIGVTDGAQFGGFGPYETTSGSGFLGTTDEDLFVDGNDLVFRFAPVNAFGIYLITADPMADDDVILSNGIEQVALVAAEVDRTLPAGDSAFFFGLVDAAATFSSVSLTTAGNGAFFYSLDDIRLGTRPAAPAPAPGGLALLLLGLGIQFAARRRAKRAVH